MKSLPMMITSDICQGILVRRSTAIYVVMNYIITNVMTQSAICVIMNQHWPIKMVRLQIRDQIKNKIMLKIWILMMKRRKKMVMMMMTVPKLHRIIMMMMLKISRVMMMEEINMTRLLKTPTWNRSRVTSPIVSHRHPTRNKNIASVNGIVATVMVKKILLRHLLMMVNPLVKKSHKTIKTSPRIAVMIITTSNFRHTSTFSFDLMSYIIMTQMIFTRRNCYRNITTMVISTILKKSTTYQTRGSMTLI